jgi:hypothetical protein
VPKFQHDSPDVLVKVMGFRHKSVALVVSLRDTTRRERFRPRRGAASPRCRLYRHARRWKCTSGSVQLTRPIEHRPSLRTHAGSTHMNSWLEASIEFGVFSTAKHVLARLSPPQDVRASA